MVCCSRSTRVVDREEVMKYYRAYCNCTLFGVISDTELCELGVLGEDGITNWCGYCNIPFVLEFQYEEKVGA